MSLSDMVSSLFFGLMSLIKLADLDGMNFNIVESQKRFFQQGTTVKKVELIWLESEVI